MKMASLHRFTWALGAGLLLAAILPAAAEDGYPCAKLSNGTLELSAYLPDTQKGYYRSSRFDCSSMLAGVEYSGHRFFGDFTSPHLPEETDAASGFAEEFQTPQGYDACGAGGRFLKIGAGVFTRVDDVSYEFGRRYPLVDPGVWRVSKGLAWIEFTHEAELPPYAYKLLRRISLAGASVIVERTLTNTGTAPLVTNHYAHNFTMVDALPVGPGYSASFNFKLMTGSKWGGLLETSENGMRFLRALGREENCGIFPAGCDASRAGSATSVYNSDAKAGMLVESRFPVAQCFLFSTGLALCPESFFHIELKPKESVTWTSRYTFYTGEGWKFSTSELETHSQAGLSELLIDGRPFGEFSNSRRKFGFALLGSSAPLPKVEGRATPSSAAVAVRQASPQDLRALISVTPKDSGGSVDYEVDFVRTSVAKVTASTCRGTIPESSLDGDSETSWAATGDNHWICYEMEAPRKVSGLEISWISGDKRRTRFDVDLSSDGKAWTRVFSGLNSGSTSGLEAVPFTSSADDARFVKITGHGNNRSMVTNISEVVFK